MTNSKKPTPEQMEEQLKKEQKENRIPVRLPKCLYRQQAENRDKIYIYPCTLCNTFRKSKNRKLLRGSVCNSCSGTACFSGEGVK